MLGLGNGDYNMVMTFAVRQRIRRKAEIWARRYRLMSSLVCPVPFADTGSRSIFLESPVRTPPRQRKGGTHFRPSTIVENGPHLYAKIPVADQKTPLRKSLIVA